MVVINMVYWLEMCMVQLSVINRLHWLGNMIVIDMLIGLKHSNY